MAKRAVIKRSKTSSRTSVHRRHNPRSIPINPNYSQGLEAAPGSRLLAIAGQVGRDAKGRIPAGIDAQAKLAWANVKAVLKEAGMDVNDLVHYFSFLVRREDNAGYDKARIEALGNARPASTKVFISGLARPELLCEVQAIAAKSDRAKPKPRKR
jgi:enamine deaminase RidA (YjgF/YER057c/UK114 family)